MQTSAILHPFFLCDHCVVTVDFNPVSDMQFAFFSQYIAVIHLFYVGINQFGYPADFLRLAVNVDRLSGATVLLGADIDIRFGALPPLLSEGVLSR